MSNCVCDIRTIESHLNHIVRRCMLHNHPPTLKLHLQPSCCCWCECQNLVLGCVLHVGESTNLSASALSISGCSVSGRLVAAFAYLACMPVLAQGMCMPARLKGCADMAGGQASSMARWPPSFKPEQIPYRLELCAARQTGPGRPCHSAPRPSCQESHTLIGERQRQPSCSSFGARGLRACPCGCWRHCC